MINLANLNKLLLLIYYFSMKRVKNEPEFPLISYPISSLPIQDGITMGRYGTHDVKSRTILERKG